MPTCDDCGFEAKSERGLGLHAAAKHPHPAPVGSIESDVRESSDSMGWLTDQDKGIVRLALTYAHRIDQAVESGSGQDVTKALYLGPHLVNALRELGGTPAAREKMNLEEKVGSKLAQLRAIDGGKR